MAMASSFERLPTEIRHLILFPIVWDSRTPPDISRTCPDRVRLKDSWDIWVQPITPAPPALSLLLTSRTLYHDVRRIASAASRPYEIDIAFVPECGLFPTWTMCPLPSETHIPTLRVSIRILSAPDIDREGSTIIPPMFPFAYRFPGKNCLFDDYDIDLHPPPGACNFYHLLSRFFTLGPLGVVSSAARPLTRRYSVTTLVITTTSKPRTIWEDMMDFFPTRRADPQYRGLPFSNSWDPPIFGSPPVDSEYVWSGPSTPSTAYHCTDSHSGERLGLYLSLAFWWLLDLSGPGARAYGLPVFEGVLGRVEFWVDGERRERPVYETGRMLERLPVSGSMAPQDGVSGRRPEVEEGVEAWKRWAAVLAPEFLDGQRNNPFQLEGRRNAAALSLRERMGHDAPVKMLESLAAWRRWVEDWRRERGEGCHYSSDLTNMVGPQESGLALDCLPEKRYTK